MPQDTLYPITKNLITAAIIGLRNSFSDHSKYTYTDDMETTSIEITDLNSQEVAFFPAIIISGISGPSSSIYFGDDFLMEVKDEDGNLIGEQHGNQLKLELNLTIYALSTIAREELVDLTYLFLKTMTEDFSELGIEVRYINIGSPSTETVGTRVFHKQTLSVDTYSEWTVIKDVIPSEIISDIGVTVIQEIVPFN